ncbi:MAG: TetR/AcrR family transcriptional regulator [Gammaproteobacteria bacterium]|nr:TetR/AcrR family transcriptional regulator [Gammaproteobacteria bacterium]
MSTTKNKILDIALREFNKHSTRVVTTNHIAEACTISPGNLYYHYRNKEAIIFSLFEKMVSEWDDEVLNLENKSPDEILYQQLNKTFECIWKYRFVHRELASLLDKDSALKKMCNLVFQRRLKEIEGFLQLFEQMNVLRPLSKEQRGFIAQTALYYGLFWQPYLEVVGERPTKKNVMRGVQMIQLLLEPYQRVSP